MENYELYIKPIKFSKKNKSWFEKGHIPHNKGMKWSDIGYTQENKQKMLEGLKKGWLTVNTGITVRNRKPIVAFDSKNHLKFFSCAMDACLQLGWNKGFMRNVKNCCTHKRKTCKGWRFFFEEDVAWCEYLRTHK
jgi:hypothetical protein